MKIRTRVKIAGALVIAVLLAYGAVVLRLDRTMNDLVRQASETNEFVNKISMLRNLTQDYLLYRTERAQTQWSAVYAEVLAAVEQPKHRVLESGDLKDVSQKLRVVGDIFARLMSSDRPAVANKTAAKENDELKNRLTTQLLLTTQDLLTRYFNLADRVNEKLIVTQRLSSFLDFLALLLLALLLLSNAVFLQRAVVRPVLRLHEGAEIIGAGNLDHRVALDSGDEIGDLARAFNRMTASLQKVTVSRDELIREMAERRRVEAALKDSEARLRLAQDAAKAGTWEWDLRTNQNYWSPELWPLYGLEPFSCEPCYDNWLQTVHPLDRENVTQAVQEAARQGTELNAEWRVHDPDGHERWLMSRGRPWENSKGKIAGYIGIVMDITELKQVEEAWRESEERLRLLGDNLPESAVYQYMHGSDGKVRFLYMSAGIEKLNGVTVQEVLADAGILYRQIPPEYYPQLVAAEAQSAREMADFDMEVPMRRADGEIRWMRLHSRPRRLPDGLVVWDGVQSDVTERRRAETALQERSAELLQAVADLEAANAEMERFTYTISHDLKSPLVTISTFLKYLEEDLRQGDAARVDKDLHFMRTAADKMGQLLHELLEMSRIGRMVNPPVEVGFQELVQEVLQTLAGAMAERGVAVQVHPENVRLFGDRPRLVQVWQNLVENGIKYLGNQPEPRLIIGQEQQGQDMVFSVCDNGMGIEPQYQDKIFGLFEKLEAGTGGSGIGLAIVKRIVELYQGRIWVESTGAGQGSCFYFTLPAAVQGL